MNIKEIDKKFSYIFYFIIFGLLVVQFIRTWGYFIDDGFIMLKYVQNILNGNGWVFNLGEYYNASTSILQVWLHVILGAIFGVSHLETIAYVNFYIWLFILGVFVYKFFYFYNKYLAALIALSILVTPYLYSTFGIEIVMNMALTFIALFAYQNKKFNLLYPILSLLILTRFENGLFVAIIFLFLFFKDKEPLRKLIKNGILLSIPFILWFIFSYIYFGKIFPESLAAKIWQGESGYFGSGFIYIKSMIRYTIFFVLPWMRVLKVSISNWQMSTHELLQLLSQNIVFAAALIVTAGFSVKGLIASYNKKMLSGMPVFMIWVVVHTILYGIIFNVPGYHWYFSFVIILLFSSFFIGIYELKYKKSYVAVLLILFFLPFLMILKINTHETIEDARTTPYRNLSDWINKNTSTDAVIIHDEVGEIAYLTNRKTIDGFGLTSPQYMPFLKKGLRNIFWIQKIPDYNEMYYVSYHDVYPSPFVKKAFASMMVYDSQDILLTKLFKIDKNKFVWPAKNEVSVFSIDYKISGPKDRAGTGIIDLQPANTICSAFALHAQLASDEPVTLSVSDFTKDDKFQAFAFYSAFPSEAIEKGTDGAMIDVTATYDDGSSQTETFTHRISSVDVIQNYQYFSFKFDTSKLIKELTIRTYDLNNAFDWLHICSPVFQK